MTLLYRTLTLIKRPETNDKPTGFDEYSGRAINRIDEMSIE